MFTSCTPSSALDRLRFLIMIELFSLLQTKELSTIRRLGKMGCWVQRVGFRSTKMSPIAKPNGRDPRTWARVQSRHVDCDKGARTSSVQTIFSDAFHNWEPFKMPSGLDKPERVGHRTFGVADCAVHTSHTRLAAQRTWQRQHCTLRLVSRHGIAAL